VAAGDRLNELAGELAHSAVDVDVALDQVVALRRDAEGYELRVELLRAAYAAACDRQNAVIDEQRDAIIVEHIRPACDETVATARKAIDQYRKHGTTERELLVAPAAARAAWVEFDRCAVWYGVLRSVRSRLVAGDVQHDMRHLFAEVRDVEKVWAQIVDLNFSVGAVPPWHDDDPHRGLVKLIDGGGELWTPTASEQDERWGEVFGERVAARRRSNEMLTDARSIGR
jgi:hypothetical protein